MHNIFKENYHSFLQNIYYIGILGWAPKFQIWTTLAFAHRSYPGQRFIEPTLLPRLTICHYPDLEEFPGNHVNVMSGFHGNPAGPLQHQLLVQVHSPLLLYCEGAKQFVFWGKTTWLLVKGLRHNTAPGD